MPRKSNNELRQRNLKVDMRPAHRARNERDAKQYERSMASTLTTEQIAREILGSK